MVRLATYAFEDRAAPALVVGDEVIRIDAPDLPRSVKGLLAMGEGLARLHELQRRAPRRPLDRKRLLPPLPDPENFLGVGLNYRAHASEQGRELPAEPIIFAKLRQAINGPHGPIPMPDYSDTLDYEGELGIVIGKATRKMSAASAKRAIAGYMIVNDISVRALVNSGQLILGKGGRGAAPCGPWITMADEIADPQALDLRTFVNGALRQSSSTGDMHHSCAEIVAFLSRSVDLQPGDIIATGSPGGSGMGFTPPRYLVPGDRVRVEITGLGHIENVIAASEHPFP